MSSGRLGGQKEATLDSRRPKGGQMETALAARPQVEATTAAARREKLKQLEQSLFGYTGTEVTMADEYQVVVNRTCRRRHFITSVKIMSQRLSQIVGGVLDPAMLH